MFFSFFKWLCFLNWYRVILLTFRSVNGSWTSAFSRRCSVLNCVFLSLVMIPLPVHRSVCRGRHRRGRPAASLHSAHEFREGLGSWLPSPEHQGDPVLDRNSFAPCPSALGRGSAHHAYSRPATSGLMLEHLTFNLITVHIAQNDSADLWP